MQIKNRHTGVVIFQDHRTLFQDTVQAAIDTGVCLDHSDLLDCIGNDFSKVGVLRDISFNGDLDCCNFSRCTLIGCRVESIFVDECDFYGASLMECYLEDLTFRGCRLERTLFKQSGLRDSVIRNSDKEALTAFTKFEGCDLTNLATHGKHGQVHIRNCLFEHCYVTGADLSSATMFECRFSDSYHLGQEPSLPESGYQRQETAPI